MYLPPVPEIVDTGNPAKDREPVHEFIRTIRHMLASVSRTAPGVGSIPGAEEAMQARIDEAQAALDKNAEPAPAPAKTKH